MAVPVVMLVQVPWPVVVGLICRAPVAFLPVVPTWVRVSGPNSLFQPVVFVFRFGLVMEFPWRYTL